MGVTLYRTFRSNLSNISSTFSLIFLFERRAKEKLKLCIISRHGCIVYLTLIHRSNIDTRVFQHFILSTFIHCMIFHEFTIGWHFQTLYFCLFLLFMKSVMHKLFLAIMNYFMLVTINFLVWFIRSACKIAYIVHSDRIMN